MSSVSCSLLFNTGYDDNVNSRSQVTNQSVAAMRQNVSGQILSPNTKQTKITDHMNELPPHVFKQMYAGKISVKCSVNRTVINGVNNFSTLDDIYIYLSFLLMKIYLINYYSLI